MTMDSRRAREALDRAQGLILRPRSRPRVDHLSNPATVVDELARESREDFEERSAVVAELDSVLLAMETQPAATRRVWDEETWALWRALLDAWTILRFRRPEIVEPEAVESGRRGS